MKHLYIIFLLIFGFSYSQTVTPPTPLQTYYSGIDFSGSNTNLYNDLATKTIAKHTTFLSYSDRHNFLYDADENPNNANNVILIYNGESKPKTEYLSGSNPSPTQTFNTEHVFPRSLLGSGTAEADLHLLRSCKVSVNTLRGNDPFSAGSGTYASTGSSFFPGDDWRGDVARIIMYVNLRYNEPFTDVGTLNLFLEWNAVDPVSANEIEDNRNTIISGAQGNRNPFIDNPYIATLIWGGTAAQNRWQNLSVDNVKKEDIKIHPNPAKNKLNITLHNGIETKIEIYNVLGKRVLKKQINTTTSLNISALKSGIYLVKLNQNDTIITKKLIVE
ncbi:MAG: endonuclease [Winogradskyella sp.]